MPLILGLLVHVSVCIIWKSTKLMHKDVYHMHALYCNIYNS